MDKEKRINVLSLFDGVSVGQLALTELGFNINKYYAAEIEAEPIQVTNNHFPNTIQLGDVLDIKGDKLPKIDLLIGGSPCQGFSIAGKMLNFNDPRSKLFFEFVRLLKETKPKYFLLENVKMKKEWCDIISKELGVEPIEINSNLVSAQDRKRLYWTNIPNITKPADRGILLKDVLDDLPFRDLQPFVFNNYGDKRRLDMLRTIEEKKAFTLTTSRTHTNQYYLNEDRTMFRNLSINEYEALQTFPKDYTDGVSMTSRFKAVGNSWTKEVIKHIFKNLLFT